MYTTNPSYHRDAIGVFDLKHKPNKNKNLLILFFLLFQNEMVILESATLKILNILLYS
jgi:hypothetical protein